MDYADTSIDRWTGEYDEEYCYSCQKFVEADMDGKCPICEEEVEFGVDEFGSVSTTKTAISAAPSVSHHGDIWGRSGSGYTWGKETTWNRYSGQSLTGMWGSYGGYWNNNKDDDAARMLKHKRHLDSLCKVVDPAISHTLSFANASSAYTNMNTGQIVIDGSLIKDNDDMLDTVAGLAIHEKLHLVHTKPLQAWEKKYIYDNALDHVEIKLLHSIGNSVEDEYIEKQLAKDCAGFVQYITKTKQYFFKEKVKDMLEKPEQNPYIDLMNTLLAFIRYPENIDSNRKKRHAKHIQFFGRALAKAMDSRENVLKAVETLFVYMKKVAEKMSNDMPDDISKELGERISELKDKFGDTELSDEDWGEIEKKLKTDIKTKDARAGTYGKLLKGKDKERFDTTCGATSYDPEYEDKEKRMLDRELIDEIQKLEDSDYTETKLGKSDCVSPKQTKVTWQNAVPTDMDSNTYKTDSRYMKGQTNLLKRKIQLYGNRNVLTIRNQKRGKIDKRNLHRIPMDRMDIFKASITQEDKPLDVCLLVDESGSMGGHRIQDARRCCISIMEALKDNNMLNLWVMGHTADGERWHNEPNTTNMTIYHSPTVKDRMYSCGAMRAKTENRDGNAILAATQRVKEETDNPMSNKLLIVFSDGAPAAINYGGTKGIQHVAKVVKGCESKGWSVIQVGFGGATYQGEMFTNHIYIEDTNNMASKVSKIIRKVIKV